MKNKSYYLLCLLISFFHGGSGQAQEYCTLDLPKKWMKPRIISSVEFVLSKTIPELKDKQFCTGCKGGSSVALVIEPIVRNVSQKTYKKDSGWVDLKSPPDYKVVLRVYDSTGIALTQLVVIPSTLEYSYMELKKESLNDQRSSASSIKEVGIRQLEEISINPSFDKPVMSRNSTMNDQSLNVLGNPDLDRIPGTQHEPVLEASRKSLLKIKRQVENLIEAGKL